MIAVCLITCNRPAYTMLTLTSFRRHNDPSRFMLLHGDDASDDRGVTAIAQAEGFETVHASPTRQGGHRTRRAVVAEAVKRGAEHVLVLENDWEWVRPFPWDLFEYAFGRPDVYCLRLYGVMKEREGRPAGVIDAGRGIPAEWTPLPDAPEAAEIGHIHWAAPPAVTRADDVHWLLGRSDSPAGARRLSGEINEMTVRPVENVVYHMGRLRTPGFVP